MEDLIAKNPDVMIVHPVSGGNIVAQIEQVMSKNILSSCSVRRLHR
jgi:ABC-type sugar transport system substrate-binding protein